MRRSGAWSSDTHGSRRPSRISTGRSTPLATAGAIKRVADQLGTHPEALRTWVRQAEIDSGVRPGTTTDEAKRITPRGDHRPLRRPGPRVRQRVVGRRGNGPGHVADGYGPSHNAVKLVSNRYVGRRVRGLRPVRVLVTFDVPLRVLTFDDAGIGSLLSGRVDTGDEFADNGAPATVGAIGIVRGKNRPGGRWTVGQSSVQQRN